MLERLCWNSHSVTVMVRTVIVDHVGTVMVEEHWWNSDGETGMVQK